MKKVNNNPGRASATAIPLDGEESSLSDTEDPIAYVADGVRAAHSGAMRRRRIVEDEHEPVEIDRFIDPSELWP